MLCPSCLSLCSSPGPVSQSSGRPVGEGQLWVQSLYHRAGAHSLLLPQTLCSVSAVASVN